jgi:divalent metal cation (Fe/Co/Zn/Cd) transporter
VTESVGTESTGTPCPDSCAHGERRADAASALRLEYLTIAYNVIEGVVCVALGVLTSGLAILAFGIDSFIEVSASLVLVWRLRARGGAEQLARAELLARRGVGLSFLALGAYIAVESVSDLLHREPPQRSLAALAMAAASAVVMPLLGRVKRRLAIRMNMSSLASEAAQTRICGWMSLILLTALGAYQLTGWWWADAVGALAMLPIILWEGVQSFRGKACCCG